MPTSGSAYNGVVVPASDPYPPDAGRHSFQMYQGGDRIRFFTDSYSHTYMAVETAGNFLGPVQITTDDIFSGANCILRTKPWPTGPADDVLWVFYVLPGSNNLSIIKVVYNGAGSVNHYSIPRVQITYPGGHSPETYQYMDGTWDSINSRFDLALLYNTDTPYNAALAAVGVFVNLANTYTSPTIQVATDSLYPRVGSAWRGLRVDWNGGRVHAAFSMDYTAGTINLMLLQPNGTSPFTVVAGEPETVYTAAGGTGPLFSMMIDGIGKNQFAYYDAAASGSHRYGHIQRNGFNSFGSPDYLYPSGDPSGGHTIANAPTITIDQNTNDMYIVYEVKATYANGELYLSRLQDGGSWSMSNLLVGGDNNGYVDPSAQNWLDARTGQPGLPGKLWVTYDSAATLYAYGMAPGLTPNQPTIYSPAGPIGENTGFGIGWDVVGIQAHIVIKAGATIVWDSGVFNWSLPFITYLPQADNSPYTPIAPVPDLPVLTYGTQYQVQVTILNPSGSATSAWSTFTPYEAPAVTVDTAGGSSQQLDQTFTAAGEIDWTCPFGVTEIVVEGVGGGQGGSSTPSWVTGATGGDGADYAKSLLTVTPFDVYAVVVGAGGAGEPGGTGGSGGAGSNGGNSSFGGSLMIALGGGISGTSTGNVIHTAGIPGHAAIDFRGGLGGAGAPPMGGLGGIGGAGGGGHGQSGGGGGGGANEYPHSNFVKPGGKGGNGPVRITASVGASGTITQPQLQITCGYSSPQGAAMIGYEAQLLDLDGETVKADSGFIQLSTADGTFFSFLFDVSSQGLVGDVPDGGPYYLAVFATDAHRLVGESAQFPISFNFPVPGAPTALQVIPDDDNGVVDIVAELPPNVNIASAIIYERPTGTQPWRKLPPLSGDSILVPDPGPLAASPDPTFGPGVGGFGNPNSEETYYFAYDFQTSGGATNGSSVVPAIQPPTGIYRLNPTPGKICIGAWAGQHWAQNPSEPPWIETTDPRERNANPPYPLYAIRQFASYAGKPVTVIEVNLDFNQNPDWTWTWNSPKGPKTYNNYGIIDPNLLQACLDYGAVPMFSWRNWVGGPGTPMATDTTLQSQCTFGNILASSPGDPLYEYLVRCAQTIAAFGAANNGAEVIMRMFGEFNGGNHNYKNFSPGGKDFGGTPVTPLTFQTVWRYIVNLFRDNGATNATFCWSMNQWDATQTQDWYTAFNSGNHAWDPTIITTYDSIANNASYPGDDYVDYTGFDVYNRHEWKSLQTICDFMYAQLTNSTYSGGHHPPQLVPGTEGDVDRAGWAPSSAAIPIIVTEMSCYPEGKNDAYPGWPNGDNTKQNWYAIGYGYMANTYKQICAQITFAHNWSWPDSGNFGPHHDPPGSTTGPLVYNGPAAGPYDPSGAMTAFSGVMAMSAFLSTLGGDTPLVASFSIPLSDPTIFQVDVAAGVDNPPMAQAHIPVSNSGGTFTAGTITYEGTASGVTASISGNILTVTFPGPKDDSPIGIFGPILGSYSVDYCAKLFKPFDYGLVMVSDIGIKGPMSIAKNVVLGPRFGTLGFWFVEIDNSINAVAVGYFNDPSTATLQTHVEEVPISYVPHNRTKPLKGFRKTSYIDMKQAPFSLPAVYGPNGQGNGYADYAQLLAWADSHAPLLFRNPYYERRGVELENVSVYSEAGLHLIFTMDVLEIDIGLQRSLYLGRPLAVIRTGPSGLEIAVDAENLPDTTFDEDEVPLPELPPPPGILRPGLSPGSISPGSVSPGGSYYVS